MKWRPKANVLQTNDKEVHDMRQMSNMSNMCQEKKQKSQKYQCPDDGDVDEDGPARECTAAAVAMR